MKTNWVSFAIIVILISVICILLFKWSNDRDYFNEQINYQLFKTEQLNNKINRLLDENKLLKSDCDSLQNMCKSLLFELSEHRQYKDSLDDLKSQILPNKECIQNDTVKLLMKLDSVNNQIIRDFEKIIPIKDSIIRVQNKVILNDSLVISKLQLAIKTKDEEYIKQLKKEKNKRIAWQSSTGVVAAILIVLLCI